jgi:hypothetical protein
MIKVLLLGASGGLGSAVYQALCKSKRAKVVKVVRVNALVEKSSVYWNFASIPPQLFNTVDVVINCARSSDYQFNIRFNKFLCDFLDSNIRLINISSNCVLAKPRKDMLSCFFKGDAYIREKKAIEKMSFARKNTICLRPSVVLDEGSWLDFFNDCRSSKNVIVPSTCSGSKIKTIMRYSVAKQVVNASLNELNQTSDEMYDDISSLERLLGSNISQSTNGNNYFDSLVKNLLLSILSSYFMPDWLVYILQRRLVGGTKSQSSLTEVDYISVQGMTRLYLFGDHTK